MVRPGSAKSLCVGSIPTRASTFSNRKRALSLSKGSLSRHGPKSNRSIAPRSDSMSGFDSLRPDKSGLLADAREPTHASTFSNRKRALSLSKGGLHHSSAELSESRSVCRPFPTGSLKKIVVDVLQTKTHNGAAVDPSHGQQQHRFAWTRPSWRG